MNQTFTLGTQKSIVYPIGQSICKLPSDLGAVNRITCIVSPHLSAVLICYNGHVGLPKLAEFALLS